MKIKKFRLNLRIKEVYNNLKQQNIKITPEIQTMISIVEQELAEYLIPAVSTETFDIKEPKIDKFVKNIQIPKNVVSVTFIVATLGDKVDKFVSSITDEIKKSVSTAILEEYLSASLEFISKILEEKNENDVEHSTLFVLSEEFYPEILPLLSIDKIGVEYFVENKKLSPVYSTVNYMFWFRKK